MVKITILKYCAYIQLNNLRSKIICLLTGFFIATVLSTMPAQTGDWGIIAASIIVTLYEIFSKVVYAIKAKNSGILTIINNIKIGIIYGLFVDSFKLGS
uniref:Uncharacterized protein ycf20 n=1 Tax=Mastocarpus papillatus TaxID=31436 RepID=A0A342RZQ3_9FLOR|nr:conserved hypothetical plastid protein [Mastocarpus papillatus]AOL58199.1 conserved hypothetical plastid protein [Mastocarpus papillatus]